MIHRSRSSAAAAGLWVVLPLAWIAGCSGSEESLPEAGDTIRADSQEAGNLLSNTPEIAGLIKAEDPDAVIASVNGVEITAGNVTQLAQVNKIRLRSQGVALPEGIDKELMRASLQALIDGELMVEQAREEGIQPSAEEIDAEVQAARARFASQEEYEHYLTEAELTEDEVRKQAEERLLMKGYQSFVAKDYPIDEGMAREFYDANPEQFTAGEQVRAAQILVRTEQADPAAKKEEARTRIDEVHKRLTEGEDFAELAREYSQATTAANGGDLGFFPRGVMVPMLEEVAFRTSPGEISPVFETLYGYNIIKVLDRREPVVKPFEEVKPQLMVELARFVENQALQVKIQELRADASIEILDADLAPAQEASAEAAVAKSDSDPG